MRNASISVGLSQAAPQPHDATNGLWTRCVNVAHMKPHNRTARGSTRGSLTQGHGGDKVPYSSLESSHVAERPLSPATVSITKEHTIPSLPFPRHHLLSHLLSISHRIEHYLPSSSDLSGISTQTTCRHKTTTTKASKAETVATASSLPRTTSTATARANPLHSTRASNRFVFPVLSNAVHDIPVHSQSSQVHAANILFSSH